MGKWVALIGAGLVICSLPIFRGAGHSRKNGVSLWRMLRDSTQTLKYSPFGHPHIPYEGAVNKASLAYRIHCQEQGYE